MGVGWRGVLGGGVGCGLARGAGRRGGMGLGWREVLGGAVGWASAALGSGRLSCSRSPVTLLARSAWLATQEILGRWAEST